MKEGIQSEKAQALIKGLSAEYDKVLEAGRIYFAEITKTKYGSSGGGVAFTIIGDDSGQVYDFRHDEYEEHFEKVDDVQFNYDSLSNLVGYFPVGSKVKFSMEKGKLLKVEKYGVSHLLEDIKKQIQDRRIYDEENPLLKAEAIISIQKEEDDLGLFISNTEYSQKDTRSFAFVSYSDEVESLYTELDGKLENLYLFYENDKLIAKSNPPFPEHGMEENTVTNIELEEDFAKRKAASEAAIKMRNDYYQTLGEVHPDTLYLSVGGFRSADWPENSTSHTSAKLNVIYTEKTTLLITNGLSNIYGSKRQDEKLEYNGIGTEFYMEFYGKIDFSLIREHFCLALLNAVTQIAINHGDIKKFMLKHGTTSIEFREDNVELWCVKGNNSNHNAASYFSEQQFKEGDRFGTLLGMPSATVAEKLQLNLEEILLVNVKPFGKEWLNSSKLGSSDTQTQIKSRQEMVAQFEKTKEQNLIPLTYQKEYIQTPPESDGIVMTNIFPFG